MAVQTDVVHREQVQRLIDRAVAQHGRIDVLLNSAGLMPLSMLAQGQVDEWERLIDVNIRGVLYGIAAALPLMQKQRSGHIVNVASIAGFKVAAGGTVYSATKHAVRAISEGLRLETKGFGIRTTIVSPGAMDTELVDSITDPAAAAVMRKSYEGAIPAASFARAVAYAIEQPDDVDVNEIVVRPTNQVF
jgi:NADP-dependent 3-hydroxy acid dehydrogenase YdfG